MSDSAPMVPGKSESRLGEPGPPLLIVGASVRAAAMSARRSGICPWAMDLFADADLRTICPAQSVTPYPAGLLREFGMAPQIPWMYTGALENHPRLIARLAQRRILLGNGPEVLSRVRDPRSLASVLAGGPVGYPETRPAEAWAVLPAAPASADRETAEPRWLYKPLRSASGMGIQVLEENALSDKRRARGVVQQFVAGTPCSAAYIAANGRAVLLGLSWQRIGDARLGAHAFRYCGSTGAVPLAPSERNQLLQLGNTLSAEFGLVGLFGVDLIRAAERYWITEVNPRYTASVEVLEQSLRLPTIAWHVAACRDGRLPQQSAVPLRGSGYWISKGILYARANVALSEAIANYLAEQNAGRDFPRIADIPPTGSEIRAGWPILSVLESGVDQEQADLALFATVTDIEAHLYAHVAPGANRL